jgi:hypothetical protein
MFFASNEHLTPHETVHSEHIKIIVNKKSYFFDWKDECDFF